MKGQKYSQTDPGKSLILSLWVLGEMEEYGPHWHDFTLFGLLIDGGV